MSGSQNEGPRLCRGIVTNVAQSLQSGQSLTDQASSKLSAVGGMLSEYWNNAKEAVTGSEWDLVNVYDHNVTGTKVGFDVLTTALLVGDVAKAGKAALVAKDLGEGGAVKVADGGASVSTGTPVPTNSVNAAVGLRNELSQQAGIPTSTSDVWGASLDDLKQAFDTGGATIANKTTSASSSGNAQIFTVERSGTGVVEVQYSPASTQSAHSGQYYKFTYADGSELKVIDPATYRVLGWPENKGKITFMNPSGKIISYDPASKTWR